MTLTGPQLEVFRHALHEGAREASDALGRWIDRPARIAIDSIEQCALEQVTSVLGTPDEPICCCSAEMSGRLTGHLILAFDDESGLALADMLLGHARGTATEWDEMATSAALETMNIVSCTYLNALLRALPEDPTVPATLTPSPPQFIHDFAESVLQFALMDQIVSSDEVLLAHTSFHIDGTPLNCTFLFVPDGATMAMLREHGS